MAENTDKSIEKYHFPSELVMIVSTNNWKQLINADYKVGLLYISPFDLVVDGKPVITKLDRKRENGAQTRLRF